MIGGVHEEATRCFSFGFFDAHMIKSLRRSRVLACNGSLHTVWPPCNAIEFVSVRSLVVEKAPSLFILFFLSSLRHSPLQQCPPEVKYLLRLWNEEEPFIPILAFNTFALVDPLHC